MFGVSSDEILRLCYSKIVKNSFEKDLLEYSESGRDDDEEEEEADIS